MGCVSDLMVLLRKSVRQHHLRPLQSANLVDLLFSNIKHLFFQPSEKELIVLIHVHLKAPIMLGKKKTSVSYPYGTNQSS
jgi:nucleosome binding factor SPN SPT16 subunit